MCGGEGGAERKSSWHSTRVFEGGKEEKGDERKGREEGRKKRVEKISNKKIGENGIQ